MQDDEAEDDLLDVYRTLGRPPPTPVDTAPPPPTPADLVVAARRFHRRLRRLLNEAVEAVGISYARFEILELLGEDDHHHVASIAAHLGTSRQAVHRLVEQLDRSGLVDRLGFDTGVKGVRITRRGRDTLNACDRHLEGFHQLFARLQPDERRALERTLNAAEAALRPPPRWI
jgi:DNA-binding MarR family transcriptional regulator